MNYPIWQLDFAGGGLLIAVIAIIHVYITHFAIGGGLFLVITEHKGLRENSREILEYVKKHTRFFLLLTMVLGALTGVGIWFTISLLNPAAVSKLVHIFVFAWAVEWVFFLTEIVSLFLYYKTFGRISDRTHLIIGWIYFISAWLSLFVINGIIDFMLTPGAWLETADFWDGFFNPTFWPALFFRSFLALMIAGLFGFLTATWIKEEKLRTNMVRYCAKWLLFPFLLFLGSAWWYKNSLPPHLQELIFQKMPEMKLFIKAFLVSSPVLLFGGLFMAIRLPAKVSRPVAGFMLIVGLVYLGAFEFIREGGRRPYIIHDYMYSTAITKSELPEIVQSGLLPKAKWVKVREINEDNKAAAGREIFNILCLSCHSVGGPFNDIKKLTAKFKPKSMKYIYKSMGMDKGRAYMPPFAGTIEEQEALTYFIFNEL
ncbi:MAG: cytochrome ubiquinol oxidase subunit I [Thermodesulfobacteriota bacterium]